MEDNKITLLEVSYNEENDMYTVKIPKGSNVNETAFCMTVVIKCMLRDKVINDVKDVTNLIEKYCNDPQYDELEDKENDNIEN